MVNPYSIFTEIKKFFYKKRIQKLLQCYNWFKSLILLNKVLLQKCYKLLQRVTKGFPTRARFKLLLKQKIFCKKALW